MTISRTQRISGPGELLQAVPYLLGFHPHLSLVLVGLDDGLLVVTARLDLGDAVAPGVVEHTVEAMRVGGTSSVVAALYEDGDPEPGRAESALTDPAPGVVADQVGRACADAGCLLLDVLRVSGRRWWSLMCASLDCCPVEGRPLPEEPSAFATAATFAGVVALPDRGALERLLDPVSDAERDSLLPGIADAEHEAVSAVLDGRAHRRERSLKRALFAAARAADVPGWCGLQGDEVARFGAALAEIGMRDSVWMAVDDGRLAGRALWRDLARRLPTPYDAPPLFLFGWAAWRSGDGALAGIAAERAVTSDPGYSAADLLLAALTRGIDPRTLPRLRLPRSA
jgi:Domain of unknown function (DUF4192)